MHVPDDGGRNPVELKEYNVEGGASDVGSPLFTKDLSSNVLLRFKNVVCLINIGLIIGDIYGLILPFFPFCFLTGFPMSPMSPTYVFPILPNGRHPPH